MGCFGGCGGNNCWWIIILLLLVCGCGNTGFGSSSNFSNCCNQGPRDNCCCD